jgi:hypothetical protein
MSRKPNCPMCGQALPDDLTEALRAPKDHDPRAFAEAFDEAEVDLGRGKGAVAAACAKVWPTVEDMLEDDEPEKRKGIGDVAVRGITKLMRFRLRQEKEDQAIPETPPPPPRESPPQQEYEITRVTCQRCAGMGCAECHGVGYSSIKKPARRGDARDPVVWTPPANG